MKTVFVIFESNGWGGLVLTHVASDFESAINWCLDNGSVGHQELKKDPDGSYELAILGRGVWNYTFREVPVDRPLKK